MKPVIEGLVRTFEKIYWDRAHRLRCQRSPDGMRFRGEKQDLEDLVGNLVDNAGKWATEQGVGAVSRRRASRASSSASARDRSWSTTTATGLAAEARELVTRRGRRLDESKPGSGLGLSIVTDLAGVYGGAFSLDDSPLGGLRAVLRLPASRTEFRLNPV